MSYDFPLRKSFERRVTQNLLRSPVSDHTTDDAHVLRVSHLPLQSRAKFKVVVDDLFFFYLGLTWLLNIVYETRNKVLITLAISSVY